MANFSVWESYRAALEYEYVIYHHKHYNQTLRSEIDGYLSPLWDRTQASIQSKVQSAALKARLSELREKGAKSADVFKFLAELRRGDAVDEVLRGIAESILEGVNQAAMMKFNTISKSAYGYASVIGEGKANAQDVQAFFDIVMQGIRVMTGGKVPQDVFNALTKIGGVLSNDASFQYQGKGVKSIKEEQLVVVNKVVTYMANAAERFKAGKLSTQSMRATLMNIFPKTLRQQIGKQLIEEAIPDIQQEVDSLSQEIFQGSNIQQIKQITVNKKAHGKIATNAVLVNGEVLTLSFNAKGANIDLTLQTNVPDDLLKQNVVSEGNIPLGAMAVGDVLKSFEVDERGIAYNIFAHERVDKTSYEKLRSVLSAHFLNEWASSKSSMSVDKSQYWLVNEELMDTPTFVARLAQDIPYGQYDSTQLSIDLTSLPASMNKWVGGSPDRNGAAQERSRYVQNVVNNTVIFGMVHL